MSADIDNLLPADTEAPPDDVLGAVEDALAGDPSALADVTVQETPPPPLGRGWQISTVVDAEGQAFVRSSGGQGALETHGLATLQTWIAKALVTEAGAFAIYPPGYGMQGALLGIGEPPTSPHLADRLDRITDALTFHPRITGVTNYSTSFDDDNEAFAERLTVVLDDETRLEIERTF